MIQKPQPVKELPTFMGQDHYYSITFRGNGEAIITLRAIFSNLKDEALSILSLRVPKVDPKDVSVYQVIREPKCISYRNPSLPTLPPIDDKKYYIQQGSAPSLTLPTIPLLNTEDLCVEYQQPDYYQYWDAQAKYKKADYHINGDTINITLPEKISINGSGSIMLYFRAIGYARKNLFGVYDFSFETLKVDDRIRNLQIGISTDSDLFLRGEQGKVDYRFDEGLASLKVAGLRGEAVRSQQLDSFYQQIGQGGIVKSANNLQPLDSYILKGSFAESRLSLYAKDIIKWLIAIIFIVLILGLLTKFIIRKFKQAGNIVQDKKFQPSIGLNIGLAGGILGLSLVVSILILGYSILVFFLQQFIYSSYNEFTGLISIFLIIISTGVYGLLLLAPSILFGMKKGIRPAILLFALTIFWLFVYLLISIIFSFFVRNPFYPAYYKSGPVMMEKSIETPLSGK